MTPPPALPGLPGLAWARHKKPGFSTRVASHVSGREVRVALMNYPLYEFETAYNGLTSAALPPAAQSGLGAASLQSLMGFFLQLMGQAGVFLYTDPDDNTATGQSIGIGDGATQCFVLGRTLGGFNEPVSWVTSIANVYLNGVVQPNANYVLEQPNTLAFYTAPGAGVAITADFDFAFQCRFLEDRMDFEEFLASLWKLGSMKFRSVKASIAPAAPPPWYNFYGVGGTLANLVADFTTEGTTDRYYDNGSTFANAAAYETAVGLSETRASAGYYASAAALLASAANNVLRFDHGSSGNPKGILLEGAGTNLALQSNSFTTSPWSAAGVAIAAAAGVSPDGTSNAASIVGNGTSGFLDTYQPITLLNGTAYTISVYAKAVGSGAYLWLGGNAGGAAAIFNLSAGTYALAGATNAAVTPFGTGGWYRCTCTFTSNATSNSIYAGITSSFSGINSGAISSANGAYVFGYQLEQSPFASSYIATTSSPASRSADSFKRTRSNPTAITKLLRATTPPGAPAAACTLWSADDGTDNNYLRVVYFSDGHIHVLAEAGGVSQANLDLGAVATNTAFAIAFTAAAGNFAASINGAAAVSSASGAMPSGLVNDRLGSGVDAGYEWFSDIALDAEWTNLTATAAQLAALS